MSEHHRLGGTRFGRIAGFGWRGGDTQQRAGIHELQRERGASGVVLGSTGAQMLSETCGAARAYR